MDDESLEQIERQIAALHPRGVGSELRAAVLADVRRELRAASWDRRLAWAAAVLLLVGVGSNVAIGPWTVGGGKSEQMRIAQSNSPQSLVQTAIVVAEATDAETGSRYAKQMAAMTGRELTADEAAAIDAAVRRAVTPHATNGNQG